MMKEAEEVWGEGVRKSFQGKRSGEKQRWLPQDGRAGLSPWHKAAEGPSLCKMCLMAACAKEGWSGFLWENKEGRTTLAALTPSCAPKY